MEIVVEQFSIHPYIGRGEDVIQFRYKMAEGFLAEEKFIKLSKGDCDMQHTRIYIAHTPPAKELAEG